MRAPQSAARPVSGAGALPRGSDHDQARPIQTGSGELIQPLPFSRAEYARRLDGVRRGMDAAGLDAFVSFGPENINWLTGHDTPAYHYVQASVVTRDADPVNLLRGIEVTNTLSRTWSRRAVAYADHEEPMEVLADLLLDLLGGAPGSAWRATASSSAPAASTCCVAGSAPSWSRRS